MLDHDLTDELAAHVAAAFRDRCPLSIAGGGTKRFLCGPLPGTSLSLIGHRGVVEYEPSELVLTARAGTPLFEIEALLAQNGQMLAFEPPSHGVAATLGGAVAAGLSGPRRPYAGALRDFVLGVCIINGKGQILHFGGKVMKNVAGFDVARLMAGAFGRLGVVLEVSLKVLPRPVHERTLCWDIADPEEAIRRMNRHASGIWPLSAQAWWGGRLYARLSGAEAALARVRAELGGDWWPEDGVWTELNEQRLPFYSRSADLWRISVPAATPPLPIAGDWLYDWGGALRWLYSDEPGQRIHALAGALGGWALLYRPRSLQAVRRAPLPAEVGRLHRRLKTAFDPGYILNPALFDDLVSHDANQSA